MSEIKEQETKEKQLQGGQLDNLIMCCGKERSTMYCSECGEKLDLKEDAIKLLKYLESHLNPLIKRHKDASLMPENNCIGTLKKYETNINKWKSWINVVHRCINDT